MSEGNEENQENQIEVLEEHNVVPLDHVEAVLNRVIPDLENALHTIQENSEKTSPKRGKCITKQDLEQALAMMRLQMVTEIRFWLFFFLLTTH